MTTTELKPTIELLADVSSQQWMWKTPRMLAIAIAIIKFFAEHDGAHYLDEIKLDVPADDRNCIGNCVCHLKARGLLEMTRQWRRSRRPASNARIIWEYRLASASLAREFLRRNQIAIKSKAEQIDLL